MVQSAMSLAVSAQTVVPKVIGYDSSFVVPTSDAQMSRKVAKSFSARGILKAINPYMT